MPFTAKRDDELALAGALEAENDESGVFPAAGE
jgi:hypothetical protein